MSGHFLTLIAEYNVTFVVNARRVMMLKLCL